MLIPLPEQRVKTAQAAKIGFSDCMKQSLGGKHFNFMNENSNNFHNQTVKTKIFNGQFLGNFYSFFYFPEETC